MVGETAFCPPSFPTTTRTPPDRGYRSPLCFAIRSSLRDAFSAGRAARSCALRLLPQILSEDSRLTAPVPARAVVTGRFTFASSLSMAHAVVSPLARRSRGLKAKSHARPSRARDPRARIPCRFACPFTRSLRAAASVAPLSCHASCRPLTARPSYRQSGRAIRRHDPLNDKETTDVRT